MPIAVECSRCHKRLAVPETFKGTHGVCPGCGERVPIVRTVDSWRTAVEPTSGAQPPRSVAISPTATLAHSSIGEAAAPEPSQPSVINNQARGTLADPTATWMLVACLTGPIFVMQMGPALDSSVPLLFAGVGTAVGVWLYWKTCRPNVRQLGDPVATCGLSAFLFTLVIGIVLLSLFQQFAAMAADGSIKVSSTGIGAVLMWLVRLIGTCYQMGAVGEDSSEHGFLVNFLSVTFSVGLCEEAVKIIPVVYVLRSKKFATLGFRDIVFIGACSGLGFGIGEGLNYAYTIYLPQGAPFGMYVVRFLACAIGHGVYTMLPSMILFAWRDVVRARVKGGQLGFLAVLGFYIVVALPSSAFHALYDVICGLPLAGALMDGAFTFVLIGTSYPLSVLSITPEQVVEHGVVERFHESTPKLTPNRTSSWIGGGVVGVVILVIISTGSVDVSQTPLGVSQSPQTVPISFGPFSYAPPTGWSQSQNPGQRYPSFVNRKPGRNHLASLNVQVMPLRESVEHVVSAVILDGIQTTPGFQLFSREQFETSQRLPGARLVFRHEMLAGHPAIAIQYLIADQQSPQTCYILTGTVPSGELTDAELLLATFDQCALTFTLAWAR